MREREKLKRERERDRKIMETENYIKAFCSLLLSTISNCPSIELRGISTDTTSLLNICLYWMYSLDMLAAPQETLELQHKQSKEGEQKYILIFVLDKLKICRFCLFSVTLFHRRAGKIKSFVFHHQTMRFDGNFSPFFLEKWKRAFFSTCFGIFF